MSWLSSALKGVGKAVSGITKGPLGGALSALIPGVGPWLAGANLLSGKGSAADILGLGIPGLDKILGKDFMKFAGSTQGSMMLKNMMLNGSQPTPQYLKYSDGMMGGLQKYLNMSKDQMQELSPEWTSARMAAYKGAWDRNAQLAGNMQKGSDPNPNQFDTNRDISNAVSANMLGKDWAEKELGVETTRLGLQGQASQRYLGGLMGGLEGGLRMDQWAYPNMLENAKYAYMAGSEVGGNSAPVDTKGTNRPSWELPAWSSGSAAGGGDFWNPEMLRRYMQVPGEELWKQKRTPGQKIGVRY